MADSPTTHFVYAKLWEPIQPLDRGARYEDPLQTALDSASLGEVTGGGSLVTSAGEITYAGIDLELADLDVYHRAASRSSSRAASWNSTARLNAA